MMKHVLKGALVLITVFTGVQAMAQIEITRDNFPAEDRINTNYERGFVSGSQNFPELTDGQNQTWDFSQLNIETYYTAEFSANNHTGVYADASYRQRLDRTIAGFPFRSYSYFQVDENGTREIGRWQKDTTHSLMMVTGGANDKAVIIEKETVFPKTADLITFPAKYGSTWGGTAHMQAYFNLTVEAFGMNNTEFYLQQYRTREREVVGEGVVKIPVKSGETSREIKVLLVRSREIYTDSVFTIDGNPAPPMLLQAFGFAQGDTSTNELSYFFVAEDFGFSVADFFMDEDGNVTEAYFTAQANEIPLKLAQPQIIAHKAYPTVLSPGARLQFSAEGQLNVQSVKLIGVDGREWQLKPGATGSVFIMPQGMPAGMYVYDATTEEAHKRLKGKVLVTR